MYMGSWKINDLLTFVANTHNPTNGMAQDAVAAPSYHVYEDETVAPILTGTMATLNSPNTLGFYSEQITLSAANGFEKGKSYNIYIRAVVANVTGTMSHAFQIEAEVDANTVSTTVDSNLVQIDGQSTNGNNATLNLKKLDIRNNAGTAVVMDSSGGDGDGIAISGDGNGYGVSVIGGNSSGVGMRLAGSGLGDALQLASPSGKSILASNDITVSDGVLNLANIADTMWDEILSGHLVVGSAGHTLWSRMPSGTVIVSANQDKTGYFLGTPQVYDRIGNTSGTWTGNIIGNISGTVGQILDVTAALANKIADHTIRRSFANARASSDGDAVSFRSLLGAIAKLVNRWSISGSTLTVYAEDDSTSLGTQALTSDAAAEPITQIDTN